MAKKKNNLTLEEKLKNALVPEEEQPYQIPENWVWTRLTEAYTNVTSSKKKLKEKEYLINGEYPVIDQGKTKIGGYSNNKELLYNMDLPVIVFGDHTRSIKHIDFNFIQGADGVKVLKPKENWYPKCFYYALLSVPIQDLGYRRHFSVFKNFFIPLPPLFEQQRIVERIESLFSKLDEAKEKIQMSLDSFENRKSAILYKAFSGELTKKWREENGIKFDEWEELNLDSVINRVNEKFDPQNNESNYKYIGLEHLEKNNGIIGYGLSEEVKSIKSVFKKGNILYGRLRPYLNKHDIAKFDGICSTDILVYSNKENCISEYVNFLMDTIGFIEFAVKNSKGINLPRVSDKSLSQYRLLLPPLEEQKEIVRILDTIFDKEQDIQQLIDLIEKIDLMKKSILARAFRGELGTNLPKEESAVELLKSVLEV